MALSEREKTFADLYIKYGNAYQAALEAGYSDTTAKHSSRWINSKEGSKKSNKNSKFKPEVRKYIDDRMAEKNKDLIASQDEVLQYLTNVMRGKTLSEEIVIEGKGDGFSEARRMEKAPSEADRIKAANLLGKRYGTFTDKINLEVEPVEIHNDLEE